MPKLALYVALEAKPGKEDALADLLRHAQAMVQAEPGTIAWFAVRLGRSHFAIFDAFSSEHGRDAHLAGKVAAALQERASELLTSPPEIQKADVLASKISLAPVEGVISSPKTATR
ncbi:putative quinol monooxygenase [Dongia soli]|uniref:Antibiotic biosynthesis monooxygenase n=1 Tax=Dongia soli TaxID=600628 RepID=A0ABU5EFA2_9PROT|nr:antibiotic biosynthesis monooxygenase [Dongia soli]MDY0884602.1 antibiotic biosynthesis monooxygenase [Dongia soli]